MKLQEYMTLLEQEELKNTKGEELSNEQKATLIMSQLEFCTSKLPPELDVLNQCCHLTDIKQLRVLLENNNYFTGDLKSSEEILLKNKIEAFQSRLPNSDAAIEELIQTHDKQFLLYVLGEMCFILTEISKKHNGYLNRNLSGAKKNMDLLDKLPSSLMNTITYI